MKFFTVFRKKILFHNEPPIHFLFNFHQTMLPLFSPTNLKYIQQVHNSYRGDINDVSTHY